MADIREEGTIQYIDGWHAHRLGVPQERNPYDENTSHISHKLWLAGWCRRFGMCKNADPGHVDYKDENYDIY